MTTAASHPPTAPLSSAWSALPPEYAIPDHAPSEAEAREYCRRLARSHYENFSVASWFLPGRLRQHFFNVYAYCRISDDLGDEVGDTRRIAAVARSVGDGVRRVLRRRHTGPGIPYLSRSPRPCASSKFRSMNSRIC